MFGELAHVNRLETLVIAWRVLAAVGVLLAAIFGSAVPAAAAPGPPDAPEWWFDAWQVPSVWSAGARGQGIVIAEIDTGVNASLPELSANVMPGKDFGNLNLDGRIDHELDTFGHGTAMASLMIARTGLYDITGLAPDAKLMPIAVPIHGTDDAPAAGNDKVPDAIRWAVDHGGKIVSMSLGGERYASRDRFACPQDEQNAITYAISKGAIVVASSGNAGQKGSPVEDPGVCLGVVSVGAIDHSRTVASFSSRHPYLTVTAPGVSIPSLGREAGTAFIGDGTSQATALTSAALALIWSKYPALTARQVVARMLATVDRRTAWPDRAYGYGILNLKAAVTTAVPLTAANPVYAALDPFLARQKAREAATHSPAPPPAATRQAPPGHFVVGPPPDKVPASLIAGTVLAAVGLASLATLTAVGIRSRRRRQTLVQPSTPSPEPSAWSGVVWYEVTAPEEPPPAPAVEQDPTTDELPVVPGLKPPPSSERS